MGFRLCLYQKYQKLAEDGVEFNSHIDGKKFFLTPEESIQVQLDLNSDIVMVFDECPKYSSEKDLIKKSMDLSLRWAERCKKKFGKQESKWLFGITQGGIFPRSSKRMFKKINRYWF